MFTGIARCTGIISHASTLVTAILVLTGAAILRGGAAAADPNQDDQFLALLDQEGIPALEGVPYLIDTAHKVCRAVDAGYSGDAVVNAMVQFAYSQDPAERQYDPGRLARTEARFITASVEAYCPYDRGKIASLVANPASFWGKTQYAHHAVDSRGAALGLPLAMETFKVPAAWHESVAAGVVRLSYAVPSGDITQPNPPEIPPPPPPPPVAHLRTPPQPIAAPPRPRQAAPAPQHPAPAPEQPAPAPEQPAPPPEQPAPPPEHPAPPPPQPAPPMAPGFVRLAP